MLSRLSPRFATGNRTMSKLRGMWDWLNENLSPNLPELPPGVVGTPLEADPEVIDAAGQKLSGVVQGMKDTVSGVIQDVAQSLPELPPGVVGTPLEADPEVIDAAGQKLSG